MSAKDLVIGVHLAKLAGFECVMVAYSIEMKLKKKLHYNPLNILAVYLQSYQQIDVDTKNTLTLNYF